MRRHKSAAKPVEIARQAVEAAREAAQNMDVNDVRDAVVAQAARAAEAAQNVDLNEVRDTVTSEVAKDYELVLDETRRRPLRSLLIALGLGAVVGAVLDRRRRRREKQSKPQWGPS
jgi:hypothetical protein